MLLMDSITCPAVGFGDRESGGVEEAMSGKVASQTPPTPSPLTPTPPTTPAVMTVSENEHPQGAATAAAKAPVCSATSSSATCVQESDIDSKSTSFSTDTDPKRSKEPISISQDQTDKSTLYPHLHSQLTQIQQRTQSRKKKEDQQHKFHVDEMQSKSAASNQKNQRSSTTSETPRSRSRRRARWKLKFHHQALPPEYLDHYEASLTRASGSPSTTANDSSQPARIIGSRAPRTADRKRSTPSTSTLALSAPPATTTPPTPPNMSQAPPHGIALEALAQFRALCARDEETAAVMARLDAQVMDACKARVPELPSSEPSRFTNKALLTNLLNNRARQAEQDATASSMKAHHQTPPPRRPPGKVMTFQDLPYMGEMTLDNVKPRRGRKPKKADICHLIYKNYGTILKGAEETQGPLPVQRKSPPGLSRVTRPPDKTAVQRRLMSSLLERRLTEDLLDRSEEPLNLCLRDLNQLKIRLLQKQSGSSLPPMEDKRPSSVPSPFSMNIKSEPGSPSPEGVLVEVDADPSGLVGCHSDDGQMDDDISSYWTAPPQAPVFVHPLQLYNLGSFRALQTQNNIDPATTPSPVDGSLDPESLCARLGFNPGDSPSIHSGSPPDIPHLTPFAMPMPKKPQPAPSLLTDKADSPGGAAGVTGGRGAPDTWSSTSTTKRKRSAIFVPTVAADSPNATTEVSICKFKFTGGERPVLQKKKMLSVDAGGNFRYYSGPSDERLFPPTQPPQPATRYPSRTPTPQRPLTPPEGPQNLNAPANRKKKTKKSLAREKLEKTFKEKGFLIQTQQLESAEGATYCKFRQLRKFTRYLFRSWKDYLPGNVRDMSMAAGVAMNEDQQQSLQNILPVLEETGVTGVE